ncbi:putative metalloprotease with PDZ domain [Christiangramia gaetbulicola]|uniref:Putative metalloprotease with PDZ domain n=2 Tax=Christiangramia gaetbulicola TaxID=703340 RepID=A0A2T6AFS8_9FLAO|nr:putative metalloprotease with PDZ domain [Christiangramia gaetbulicola]
MGVAAASLLFACKTQNVPQTQTEQPIVASINLVDVQDDKVWVTVDPDRFTVDSTTFNIPKTVPGTYSEDNYGKFSEGFKALDYKGNELAFTKLDDNSYSITDARNLDKVMYQVNDSFDWENEGGVYSMAGTNILKDENFLLNLHGFVGYFDKMKEKEFRLEIVRPADLIPASSLTVDNTTSGENNTKTDVFKLDRYFEVIDNPIMYSAPDTTSFMVQDMQVLLSVYSPNKKHSAQSLKPGMEKMIRAQKRFLGDINSTDKYAILVYLSDSPGEGNAGNFGALEHHTSTVVVMPESMEPKALDKSMTDIVSHEFFHIITPLGIHSNEVHYFDYNDPKMSQHLWMYEGVTEYFANLFQVNQGLINNQEFYNRMVEKITTSQRFDDTVPFTVMSKNILEDEYKDSYYNVYLKGALIGMTLDIRLRELSGGKMGILDLMKKLNERYGKDKPFNDDELIPVIVELTYPEIQEFFDTYVSGKTPIPYDEFFEKVGLEEKEMMTEVGYFINGQTPYITANQQTMEILFRDNMELNTFLKDLGIEGGDTLKSVNGTEYNIKNVYDLIMASQNWSEGNDITMTVKRDGEEIKLEGKISTPKDMDKTYVEMQNADGEQIELRNAWLKG